MTAPQEKSAISSSDVHADIDNTRHVVDTSCCMRTTNSAPRTFVRPTYEPSSSFSRKLRGRRRSSSLFFKQGSITSMSTTGTSCSSGLSCCSEFADSQEKLQTLKKETSIALENALKYSESLDVDIQKNLQYLHKLEKRQIIQNKRLQESRTELNKLEEEVHREMIAFLAAAPVNEKEKCEVQETFTCNNSVMKICKRMLKRGRKKEKNKTIAEMRMRILSRNIIIDSMKCAIEDETYES
ncbi:predicted protein [Chaetoceros tenuissimus]|uniref:Uncharacterized protein n=1 Tax=Chaetoceros tenuissimus TaxID=426638 RepID=A0AAD3CQA0_9STRA|nr:predicted protein [Chaetoceros tenuissimus]